VRGDGLDRRPFFDISMEDSYMKYSAILLLLLVSSFGTLSVSAQCDPASQGAIRCSYYNEGYQDGVSDATSNRSRDYKRYRNKYENRYESNFRDGYNAGYDSARPGWGGGSGTWGSA
jgi:hypothetical protein